MHITLRAGVISEYLGAHEPTQFSACLSSITMTAFPLPALIFTLKFLVIDTIYKYGNRTECSPICLYIVII